MKLPVSVALLFSKGGCCGVLGLLRELGWLGKGSGEIENWRACMILLFNRAKILLFLPYALSLAVSSLSLL